MSLKQMREKEAAKKDAELKVKAEELARQRYGGKLDEWRKTFRNVWFLIVDQDGEIDKMAVMKPINRHILSFASSKIEDAGLYSFLEACMRETWLEGDEELLEDDAYFIPASMQFNKMIEGKKATFVKS